MATTNTTNTLLLIVLGVLVLFGSFLGDVDVLFS